MDRFLTCSRELFNTYFRQPDPWSDPHRAWHLRDRFEPVRSALFRGLVAEPHGLQPLDYGQLHPQISVVARQAGELPVLLNRESGATAGEWDAPVNRRTRPVMAILRAMMDLGFGYAAARSALVGCQFHGRSSSIWLAG